MKKKKEPKKRPYKSVWSNALWSFQGIFRYAPAAFVLMVLDVPLEIFLTYTGIYLPSLVVAEVTAQGDFAHAARRVGGLIALMVVIEVLRKFTGTLSQTTLMKYRFVRAAENYQKSMSCFFQDYEKKENRDLCQRAEKAMETWNGVQHIFDMPMQSMKLVKNVISYCLFGTVISAVSPLLVPILTVAPIVNWLCARAYQKWEYGHRDKWTEIDTRLGYIQTKTSDFAAAKDIRIYGMAEWFRETFRSLSQQRVVWDRRQMWRSFFSRIADLFVILLRDGAAYAILIAMTLGGEITVDKFVLYFSAISMFANFIGGIMDSWNRIHSSSLVLCDFREFQDLQEREKEGEEDVTLHLGAAPEITFDHVTFRYDGAENDTLRDISFTLRAGEKVALVGLNGAGKTTLVKLLCGLYEPTGGDIRINGVSVRKFASRDYYRLFAPAFQETVTAFFSLAETVSGEIGGECDEERAERCIRMAGLGEKIDALPRGIHTRLDKQVNRDGTELSGGELQKLMFARALYKDAPVLVLDEPTAALDPIAESRLYLQYRDLTREKTSLFISHRLASTQFCDRILYMKDGRIAEEGNHRELIALGGEYSRLYEMQSCWYRDSYTTPDTDKTTDFSAGKEAEA